MKHTALPAVQFCLVLYMCVDYRVHIERVVRSQKHVSSRSWPSQYPSTAHLLPELFCPSGQLGVLVPFLQGKAYDSFRVDIFSCLNLHSYSLNYIYLNNV